MEVTKESLILPCLAILVGLGCIYLYKGMGAGSVWLAGGSFFITIGISAYTLTLAWTAPGRLGVFLRSPIVSIVIVLAVLITLLWTVFLAIFSNFR